MKQIENHKCKETNMIFLINVKIRTFFEQFLQRSREDTDHFTSSIGYGTQAADSQDQEAICICDDTLRSPHRDRHLPKTTAYLEVIPLTDPIYTSHVRLDINSHTQKLDCDYRFTLSIKRLGFGGVPTTISEDS
jgi:hypothetical protein